MSKHRLYECPARCDGCMFCNGGLALCTVCGGGEGSLPTDCPGEKMTDLVEASVYAGRTDYVNGEWVDK